MMKVLSVLLFVCVLSSVEACKKKKSPPPSCTYQKCSGSSYSGYPRRNYDDTLALGKCVTEKNSVSHRYVTERRSQHQCPGKVYCSTRDQFKTTCRCRVAIAVDSGWSEWHKDSSDGGCRMKRVMNQDIKLENRVVANKCPPEGDFKPRMEVKKC